LARRLVLIVDDELFVRQLLRECLGTIYDVDEADSASAALTAIEQRRPDVVLLDLRMPGELTGVQLIRTVARIAPVIVITGDMDVDLARRTLMDGAFDILVKPFDLHRLRALVETALRSTG
jgi:DNA-binding NtrC family response regulator